MYVGVSLCVKKSVDVDICMLCSCSRFCVVFFLESVYCCHLFKTSSLCLSLFCAWRDAKCFYTTFLYSASSCFSCLCSKPNLYRTKQSIFWITTTNKQLLHIHKIYSNLWAERAARVLVFASYNEHFFSKSPCNKCLCVCVSLTQCSRRFLHCAYRYSERFCRVFVVIFVVARHDGSLSFSVDWKAISDSLVFPCDWIKSILNE